MWFLEVGVVLHFILFNFDATHFICPAQVGDPQITTQISNDLLRKYGHYIQAINYPTVPKGEEKLRLAPTPHHTTYVV